MMELFILRHGHAQDYAPRDRDRQLSERGREELHGVLQECQEALQNLQYIFVSPYVRAQQTAEVVAEYLVDVPRETLDNLSPNSDPLKLINELAAKDLQAMLLVSHQPLVGELVNRLCGVEVGHYPMATAALAALDMDILASACAELRWLK